jgi:hypothetical protein
MSGWTPGFLTKRFAHPALCVLGAARGPILNILVAGVALMIFGATFRAGIDGGMDRLVSMEGYGRVLNAIAAVMTNQRFHEGGYALSNCIYSELEGRGFTADPKIAKQAGTTVPQNLRAYFLDKLLEDTERDLPKLQSHCAVAIRGLGADDLGYVDFAQIAFSLFGLQIRAFYYLFFLIYGLTLFTALVERRGDAVAQIILLSTAGLIYVACYYSTLLLPEPGGAGNMLNPRFMPVLALIPGIHLLLLTVDSDRAPPSWWRIPVVIFQSGVIFFAIHIRATAVFWVPALLLAAVVLFLLALRGRKGAAEGWGSVAYRGLIGQWPAIVALIVILGSLKAVAWSLHPVYRVGGWVPYHAVWHSVYYSLQLHPKYTEKYAAYHDNRGGDEMPYAAALAYLKEHPDEDNPNLFIADRHLKYDAMERLVRLAFFEFLRRDPWFVLETFVVVKGKLVWNAILGTTVTEWSRAGWKARFLLFLPIGLIAGMAAARPVEQKRLLRLATLVTVAAMGSLAIPILILPVRESMVEAIVATQIACMLVLSLAVAHFIRVMVLSKTEPEMVTRPSE